MGGSLQRKCGKRLSKKDVQLGILRHHIETIAAYLLTVRHNGEPARHARCAVRECVRELAIAPAEIDRRREALGIRDEESE